MGCRLNINLADDETLVCWLGVPSDKSDSLDEG